jgi:outer membrane receptor protein involved in Fe transport
MHINYGKFFQRPDLNKLFIGYDFMSARFGAGSFLPFANPNLEPEKITQYEVGINHQLGDNTAFGITAYYKDVEDLTQIYHQAPAFPTQYDFYGNVDFGTIKGVDFDLSMRRTRNMSINFKYSLSYANGTGSYANSSYNIAWKNAKGAPKQTQPLDYDQRHSIIFMFDFRTLKGEGPKMGNFHPLENFGLNTIIQAASGLPYTPMRIYDAVSPNAAVTQTPTGAINSATMPWTLTIDLKFERSFALGDYKLVPYVWVRNLLDRDNVVNVYEGTGEPNTSGYIVAGEGATKAEDPEYAYRYDLLQNNPKNYANPRMILFGLRLSF